jgi:hypothetical protein
MGIGNTNINSLARSLGSLFLQMMDRRRSHHHVDQFQSQQTVRVWVNDDLWCAKRFLIIRQVISQNFNYGTQF